MKSIRILAIIVAAALPGAVLLAQGPPWMKDNPAKMSEMDQKMEADMKAQEAELDKLVAEMNAATGDKKMDAMAAVVSKMVEQRKAMHRNMAGMHMDMKGAMDCCKEGQKMHDAMKDKMSSPTPGMH
jgi:hypothetical protein